MNVVVGSQIGGGTRFLRTLMIGGVGLILSLALWSPSATAAFLGEECDGQAAEGCASVEHYSNQMQGYGRQTDYPYDGVDFNVAVNNIRLRISSGGSYSLAVSNGDYDGWHPATDTGGSTWINCISGRVYSSRITRNWQGPTSSGSDNVYSRGVYC